MAVNAYPAILADNRFSDAIPTATDTASGASVLNITDLRTYTYWQAANATGDKYITVQSPVAGSANALAIVGHNLNTAGAGVIAEYSSDGVTWTSASGGASYPANNKAFMITFTSQTALYWRLHITGLTATAPQLAVAMLGMLMSFPRYAETGLDPDNVYINADSAASESGELLGVAISFIEREVDVSWKHLTPAWVSGTFMPLWDAWLSQLKPFFWAWDLTNHPVDVYFMWISPGHGNSAKDGIQRTMPYDPVRRSLDLTLSGVKE